MSSSNIQENLANFQVFPRHVGVWEGTWIRLDADGQEIERFTGVVVKKIANNQWLQTNTYQFTDGRSVTQNFVGEVAGAGKVKIESSTPPLSNYNLIAEEYDGNLIIFRVWDKVTGVLLGIEMISLSDDNTCIRTSQGFTAEGQFRGVTLITERKTAQS